MPKRSVTIDTVLSAIAGAGLVPRGAFRLADGELADVGAIVLVGMAGRDGWPAFAASAEARDGADHPLDRWSRRVIDALARDLGAVALYPFGGPPHWPFQQWARRAEPVHPSPIGILIHPAHGLWHSYRGALGFAEALEQDAFRRKAVIASEAKQSRGREQSPTIPGSPRRFAPRDDDSVKPRHALEVPPLDTSPSPCDSCRGRPCLGGCPVGAFSVDGYDVAACAAHLKSAAGADCMTGGCLARRACPVGAEHAHGPEQAAFTMRAFLRAREAR